MKNNRLQATIVVLVLIALVGGVFTYANRASRQPAESASVGTSPDQQTTSESNAGPKSADDQTSSPGNSFEVEGVVVGDYRQPDQLKGFFLQPTDKDSGPKGVFVHCSEYEQITVGDQVRIRGVKEQAEGMIVIKPTEDRESVELEKVGHVGTLEPVELPPLSQGIDWDSLLGVLVRFADDMIIVDSYNLARYGQVTLSAERRPFVATEYIDPNDSDPTGTTVEGDQNVPAVLAAEENFRQQSIILDDGLRIQNPPKLFLQPDADDEIKSVRLGTKFKNLTGVVTKFKDSYMILPAADQAIEYAERPSRPELGKENLTVASFNVLNFFTTIDDGKNQARGADNKEELDRQRSKLTAALIALDADIIGLMELENCLQSEQSLVDSLNDSLGEATFVGVGLPDPFADAPGGQNPIRVGIIYRRDQVKPTGEVNMIVHDAFTNARTPLAQEFELVDGSAKLTVVVNHFKSKGSRSARGSEADRNDGQGSFNASRRRQATAIVEYVDSLQQAGAQNVLIIGDLNSYAQEDPIDRLRDGGLVDLLQKHAGDQKPFSYVYRGRIGCLDHAFASAELATKVTTAKVWHINSDEPHCLDYNIEHNPKSWFQPDPFRSSDHDPVLVGIRL